MLQIRNMQKQEAETLPPCLSQQINIMAKFLLLRGASFWIEKISRYQVTLFLVLHPINSKTKKDLNLYHKFRRYGNVKQWFANGLILPSGFCYQRGYFVYFNNMFVLRFEKVKKETSLLRRLQAQTLHNEAPPIGKIHQFSKIAITFESVMQFGCTLVFRISKKNCNIL